MNRKTDILYGTLMLLMSGVLFQACQQEDVLDDVTYDKETLVAQGRYLTARSADAFSLQDPTSEPQPFEVGTPYRLLAFSKKYDASAPLAETPLALYPRFNKVAREGEASGFLRFFNIDSDPDKWFGFSALEGETPGTDNLVSLDFYGFTYGVAEDAVSTYIPLDGWSGKTTSLSGLTHTESVVNGQLKDLMRGVLLNQNISTAGVESTDPDGFQNGTNYTQSVIPFKHCFSKLSFQVSQEADEDNKTLPAFGENLVLEKIEVTGTYEKGIVSLADGKVNVSGKIDRTLAFDEKFNGKVPLNNTNVGEMILFPSDGSALNNTDMGDGYPVGLKITVKSPVRTDIENMLANTGSTGGVTEKTDAAGTTWYEGTIVKDEIIDNYINSVLHFKQNTSYMLIIAFQKNSVRIITVIPQVEEWLPGEGTPGNPWQDQALGQPQMFDNLVWSDRNIGADHFDATGSDYEKCVGYFYQSGRNIPYYPYKVATYNGTGIKPGYKDKLSQDLANGNSGYNQSEYRFYPMVDDRILNMRGSAWWCMYNYDRTDKDFHGNPQMMIPETKPEDYYFDFMCGYNNWSGNGLKPEQDMHWEDGQINQPVKGSWEVPSSRDFLSIFPSTPHAGNITFRAGGENYKPMEWYPQAMGSDQKVLRVTVPYYIKDMEAPAKSNASERYTQAWNRLKENEDDGCTSAGYNYGPGYGSNPDYEPDGDPEDGFASVYVISRDGSDEEAPDILRTGNWAIRSWGTIYAIKRIYTSEAYRMRWRVKNATKSATNPCFYVEICRYRCKPDAKLTVDNYKTSYDWDHPVATIYLPICGLGDWTGEYINFGTECQYATADKIDNNGKTSAVQIKVTGNDGYNSYIAVVNGVINRNFGKQIRLRSINSSK